ncbi:MAG: polyprenyl synthetase family protein [Candidatus Zixiibacteriota bacterium]
MSLAQARPVMNSLRDFWERERRRIEAELERWLPESAAVQSRLWAAMRYAALGEGKRLRPVLAVAGFQSLRGQGEAIYPVAASLEMLHTYSLVHDDLPCMDDDDTRRGRATVHVAFDEATALLAGDALQATAFELLAHFATPEITALIARAIGADGMAGGQMADLDAEGEVPTEKLVVDIHRRKTGALIAAAIVAGGMMAGADEPTQRQLDGYGRPLGLAFQIIDDLLELTQSAEALGKPTGSDLKHQKVTYPAAVGNDTACRHAARLVAEAKTALTSYPGDPAILLALADFVIERDR